MGDLICGASKVKITPSAELLGRLYGLMGTHFAGVIDDIHVRVMMIGNGSSRALLAAWELDKAPNPDVLVPELSARYGIPEDNILFFSTHTHTAPLHSARPGDGPNARAKQPEETQAATLEFEAFLREKLFEAADAAVAGAVPARIGFGKGESYIGENRVADYFLELEDGTVYRQGSLGSNPRRKIDHTLFLMRVEDMDGKPIAFFVNYAVHCCTMILNDYDGSGKVGISADIAGQASTLLEEKFPGSVALWSSGAAGDVNPVMMNQYNFPDPETGKPSDCRDYHTAEPAKLLLLLMSRRHFADILAANRGIICDIDSADITGANEVAHMEIPHDEGDHPYEVRLKAVRIADAALCGVSGELFNSLGCAVQSMSGFKYTVMINHECSFLYNSEYIFDDYALERCITPDGRLDGLPGIFRTPLKRGYIEPALKESAEKLFLRL